MKTMRPTSCAVSRDAAASPHPANASSSGGFGNCAMGKRRGQPRLGAPPKLGDGHRAHDCGWLRGTFASEVSASDRSCQPCAAV